MQNTIHSLTRELEKRLKINENLKSLQDSTENVTAIMDKFNTYHKNQTRINYLFFILGSGLLTAVVLKHGRRRISKSK